MKMLNQDVNDNIGMDFCYAARGGGSNSHQEAKMQHPKP